MWWWEDSCLVAEWIHFTLFGIILPTIKLKVYTFLGLMNSAIKHGKTHLHHVSVWFKAARVEETFATRNSILMQDYCCGSVRRRHGTDTVNLHYADFAFCCSSD